MNRKEKKNKEHRKCHIVMSHVQMDEVPEEELEKPLTVCSPLRAETTGEFFQMNTSKNDSYQSESQSYGPHLKKESQLDTLSNEAEKLCSNRIDCENADENFLMNVKKKTNEQSPWMEADENVLFEKVEEKKTENKEQWTEDDKQSNDEGKKEAQKNSSDLKNYYSFEHINDDDKIADANLLTKLANKAGSTLTAAQPDKTLEGDKSFDNHDLHIYQPEFYQKESDFSESDFPETNQVKVNAEYAEDQLAETTVNKTAMKMIEQIIDELYDSCLKPDREALAKDDCNINKITFERAENESEQQKTSESKLLNKSNEDHPTYGANETSRLLNSSSDDELETDHVVPSYGHFKDAGTKHETNSITILSVNTNPIDSRHIVVETPIAPAKKKSIRKKTPKEQENFCSFCCFL